MGEELRLRNNLESSAVLMSLKGKDNVSVKRIFHIYNSISDIIPFFKVIFFLCWESQICEKKS